MTDNLFDNAKFGDMFLTAENKQAVFLRFSENAEYEFAMLYVEGWGNVQVFRHNGKEIYNDAAHSIISKQKEPVNEDLPKDRKTLDEYAYQCAYDMSNDWAKENATWKDVQNACKLGANWQKKQMIKEAVEVKIRYINSDICAFSKEFNRW